METNNITQQQKVNNNMAVISADNYEFQICKPEIKIYNQLPTNIYKIKFSEKTGYSLLKYMDFFGNENKIKIYGDYINKVDKIIDVYNRIDKNLGVIFTGPKGLGKTLTSKILCLKLINFGYPVIVINKYYPGLIDFIESIKQSCALLFDEFDKNFPSNNNFRGLMNGNSLYYEHGIEIDDEDVTKNFSHPSSDIQQEFLSLFDGLDTGHKLFIITCNSLMNLNKLFINRPGRFHFNIQFYYPTLDNIIEYLNDNILNQYKDQINDIVKFAGRINLNYDSLRAIVFEVNLGYKFNEFIKDINIIKSYGGTNFKISAKINGEIYETYIRDLDLFEDKIRSIVLRKIQNDIKNRKNKQRELTIIFNTKDIKTRTDVRGSYYINPKNVVINSFTDNCPPPVRAVQQELTVGDVLENNEIPKEAFNRYTEPHFNLEWIEITKLDSTNLLRY